MSDNLEQRIHKLEAYEAVRQLKADYCRWADEDSDEAGRRFAALFTTDGVLDEGEELGVVRGREALYRLHRSLWQDMRLNQHLALSPSIEIQGETATAHWRLLQLMSLPQSGTEQAFWACGFYDDRYALTDEGWRISEVKADVYFCSPYNDGWATSPMVQPFDEATLAKLHGIASTATP